MIYNTNNNNNNNNETNSNNHTSNAKRRFIYIFWGRASWEVVLGFPMTR